MITPLELLYIKNLHKGKDDTKTLAAKIGVNQYMLYDIEAGRRNLTKDVFNKIINYYNVTYDDRQSVYDEAYNLTLELFSYIITFDYGTLNKRYDESLNRINLFKDSKAFIFYDLIKAIKMEHENKNIMSEHLNICKDYLDLYDNNIIFIYSILWSFTKRLSYDYKELKEVLLKPYHKYSIIGVNEHILGMLYYQIGRIYEVENDCFEALIFYDKSINCFKNTNNIQRILQVKIQQATCYISLKNYNKAEHELLIIYDDSIKYGFKRRIVACANNLSFLYFIKHDYVNSLKFIKDARANGSRFSDLNYYEAYIIYKTGNTSDARKCIKKYIDNESDPDIMHTLKLIQSFVNENDKNVERYMELAIKDFKKLNSNLDIQLIYEMVLDYYKDRNPQRIKELLPEYIKLIR